MLVARFRSGRNSGRREKRGGGGKGRTVIGLKADRGGGGAGRGPRGLGLVGAVDDTD